MVKYHEADGMGVGRGSNMENSFQQQRSFFSGGSNGRNSTPHPHHTNALRIGDIHGRTRQILPLTRATEAEIAVYLVKNDDSNDHESDHTSGSDGEGDETWRDCAGERQEEVRRTRGVEESVTFRQRTSPHLLRAVARSASTVTAMERSQRRRARSLSESSSSIPRVSPVTKTTHGGRAVVAAPASAVDQGANGTQFTPYSSCLRVSVFIIGLMAALITTQAWFSPGLPTRVREYGIGASPVIAHHNATEVLKLRHRSIVMDFLGAASTQEGWKVMRETADVLVEKKDSPNGWPVYVKCIATVPAPASFVHSLFEWRNFETTQKVLDPFVDYIRLVAVFKEIEEGDGEEGTQESVVSNVLYCKEMRGPPLLPKRVFNTVLRTDRQHGAVVLPRSNGKRRDGETIEIIDGTLMHSCIDVRLPLLAHQEQVTSKTPKAQALSKNRGLGRLAHALELALEEDGYEGNEEPLPAEHMLFGSSDDINMVRTAEDIARLAKTPVDAVTGFHDFVSWYVDNGDSTMTSVVCMRFDLGPDIPQWLFLGTVGLISAFGMNNLKKYVHRLRAEGIKL